jgi:hypothetical protein
MPRFLRYLRIAFSATCLIACALLIALWVRSYWRFNSIAWGWGAPTQHTVVVALPIGAVVLNYAANPVDPTLAFPKWQAYPAVREILPVGGIDQAYAGFLFIRGTHGFMLALPDWLLFLFTVALGALPWFRYQFSLRTLLIATTLIAVVLGLIVWVVR